MLRLSMASMLGTEFSYHGYLCHPRRTSLCLLSSSGSSFHCGWALQWLSTRLRARLYHMLVFTCLNPYFLVASYMLHYLEVYLGILHGYWPTQTSLSAKQCLHLTAEFNLRIDGSGNKFMMDMLCFNVVFLARSLWSRHLRCATRWFFSLFSWIITLIPEISFTYFMKLLSRPRPGQTASFVRSCLSILGILCSYRHPEKLWVGIIKFVLAMWYYFIDQCNLSFV